MTDANKEIKTIAKDIVKKLNSYFAKQLKKHNIDLNENSLYNDLLIEEIGKEIIDPHPDDISHLTVIIEDYIRHQH
jgi:hypothetical protein